MEEKKRGAFIAFEGIDGSGKGTQIRLLKKHLEKLGLPVFRTMEPNDSPFGDLIHQIMIGRVKTTNDVIAANAPCAALLRPDATVFIDVNPSVTMDRIEKNRMTKELFEETGRLVETRKRYFEAFEKEKDHENVIIINGDREPELVEADIWEKLNPFFS